MHTCRKLSRSRSAIEVAAAALAILSGEAAAQCAQQWEAFVPSGIGDATITTLCVDDSGSGVPIVYVGGNFTTVGGNVPAGGVAKWDGKRWTACGGAIGGVQYPTVYASALFDDDGPGPHLTALYVGGNFTTVGGIGANYVAKWNGTYWSELGSGMDSWVKSLVVLDDDGAGPHLPALYAGGFFQTADGAPASCVARWDGSSWSAVAGGVTNSPYLAVWSMTKFDDDGSGPNPPALIVGGNFSQAGAATAYKIARWNGSSWSGFGTGLGTTPVGPVMSLASFDEDGSGPNPPALYAGGLFRTVDGAVSDNVARWNGASWTDLGGGVNNGVWSMSGFDDDGAGPHAPALYACGSFWLAGGADAKLIAKWDGASWSPVGGGLWIGAPYATAVVDLDGAGPAPARLVVAGDFTVAGPMSTPTSNRLGLAAWSGSAWGAIGGGAFAGGNTYSADQPFEMAVFDEDGTGPNPPSLFAGGDFASAGGVPAQDLARWNGWSWSAVGGGLGGGTFVLPVKTLDEDGAGPLPPALYVGGDFTTAGGASAPGLAKWNGSTWSGFGAGPGGQIQDLVVFDDDGSGPHPPALYAGGKFDVGGGVIDGVLEWDGSAWNRLAGGVGGGPSAYPPVWSLAVFDDDGTGPGLPALYAGGAFLTAGGVAASGIARWNGTAWSSLGSGLTYSIPGADPVVAALKVFDEDGTGPGLPSLFAGGAFDTAGVLSAPNCARWSGSSWSAVGSSNPILPHAFSVVDPDGPGLGIPLLVAAGQPDPGIVYWTGSNWYDLDGGVTIPGWTGDPPTVWRITVYDDDAEGPDSPAIYACGTFTSAGGLPAAHLARYFVCSTSVLSFCAGDGSARPCPCNNNGAAGRGCANSTNGAGALLTATGDTGIAGDSVALTSSGETGNVTSIFLQGSTSVAPLIYGDGLRCVGGSLKRLYIRTASAGVVTAPQASDLRITTRSAALGDPILAGYVRQYQVYYRDSNPTFCPVPTGNGFNISNGLKVAWGP